MKIDQDKKKLEQHPRFPSGEWEGFYTYSYGPQAGQHRMDFTLEFSEGKVTGSGTDDIGSYSWEGVYDLEAMTCNMTKSYRTHPVDYQGRVDENGIWGTWFIGSFRGGFHLWPKQAGEQEQEQEKKEDSLESKVVRKLRELRKVPKEQ